MSLFDCIGDGIADGSMDAGRGREAQSLFNRLRADYETRVGPDAARAQAAEDVKRIMRERAGRKRRLALLRLQGVRRNVQLMQAHRTLRGEANQADALRIFITGDENSKITGIDPTAKTLRGFYHGELTDVLKSLGRNVLGVTKEKARMDNMVLALFGEETKDRLANELAQTARSVLNRARRDFNAAGGDIPEIENYGLAMRHDARKVKAATFEEWRDAVWDDLDWSRMIDRETGLPFAAVKGVSPPRGSRGEEVLSEVYQSIATNGWSTREPSFMESGLSMANSRQLHRVLHWKGGREWLAYNKRFGADDPFTTLVSTLDGYARDTAQMRVLGPNPQAGLNFLVQSAKKAAETAPWTPGRVLGVATPQTASGEVDVAARKARAMLDLHSGAASVPVNGWMAEFLAGTRAALVAAQLGGAAISAVTDVGFQATAARRVGMDPARTMSRMMGELKGDSANAVRKGLIADQMATVGAGQARYIGEVYTPEIMSRLSDFVLRATGLTKWTEAGRHGFQLEFMGLLADQSRHSWADVTPALKRTMERKGFGEREWEVIRATELHDDGGATFLIPHELRDRTDIDAELADDLAFRLMNMIHEQTEFAVPSASLEGQAAFIDQTRPGTLIGELARSGLMYKSFGMSLLYGQTRRMYSHPTITGRLGYLAGAAATVTLMGAVSMQMKELVKGRDPQPMDNMRFVGRAMLQGGGLGIFGDFLAAETNRFGGGIESTLAGPVFGAAGEIIGLGAEAVKAATGNDHNLGRKATNFARYNTPATGMWYWSTAFQRLVFDNLQRVADPEAERAWARAEKMRRNNYGNESWWAPGDMLPSRAPDLGSALGRN